jgi:hypothetical protein
MSSSNVQNLKAEVKAAWASVAPPPAESIATILDWEYGQDTVRAFAGVRPADVDIDSPGFMAATPLLKLPSSAAAAYLGPYLVSLLQGFQIEEAIGIPADVKTRGHTIFALASPEFWPDIAAPHLSEACISALGSVVRFVVEHGDIFDLSEEERQGLERVGRAVDRRLKMSGSTGAGR